MQGVIWQTTHIEIWPPLAIVDLVVVRYVRHKQLQSWFEYFRELNNSLGSIRKCFLIGRWLVTVSPLEFVVSEHGYKVDIMGGEDDG